LVLRSVGRLDLGAGGRIGRAGGNRALQIDDGDALLRLGSGRRGGQSDGGDRRDTERQSLDKRLHQN
jgi:hypothetical protein